jgi:3-oxoacyl-[acyl-carrier protein] reductase
MELGLRDRTVLVTGGSHGIGRAVATAFAAEAARVAFTFHRDKDAATQLVGDLGGDQDRVLALPYALGDPLSAAAVVTAVTDHWGGVDVLVANAVRRPARRDRGEPFEGVPDADWLPVVAENVEGTIGLLRRVLPGMRQRGWGRVALLSTHHALTGSPGQEYQAAAKAALHGLAASLAWNVGRDGVLVNVVCPGLTSTERMLAAFPEGPRAREAELTPTGRLSTPEDVARTVLFLCSAANGNISGEAVRVSGGR